MLWAFKRMMITIKSLREIERMREAGRIAAGARTAARLALRPGITTGEVDRVVHEYILSHSAVPTFLGYGGFPGSACVSVNNEVIHGIPGKRVIRDGDIVSIDVGATYKGYVGDCAGTFPVGTVSSEALKLIRITRESFFEGIKFARVGYRLSDISSAIQQYVEKNGCGVVRDYVGHGIGSELHEDPQVPNYGRPGRGPKLVAGMTLAIEPMVNAGGAAIRNLPDGWTVKTLDGSLSAHYENTILITDGEPELLTVTD